jgi:hypothetical protein
MTLLLRPREGVVPNNMVVIPATDKTRNRTGCANVFRKAMARGERVTLREAVDILIAGW